MIETFDFWHSSVILRSLPAVHYYALCHVEFLGLCLPLYHYLILQVVDPSAEEDEDYSRSSGGTDGSGVKYKYNASSGQ